MRILVVEDEEAIAKGLRFNFEREGYQVDVAGDGPTALELYESAQPPVDLVVLDLMLPLMSGYEICRALRRLDTEIPVLAITARTLSEDKIHAFDCGFDQYMTKPFSLPELLSRIRNLKYRLESNALVADANVGRLVALEYRGDAIDFALIERLTAVTYRN